MIFKFVFFGTPEFAAIILEKLLLAGVVPTAVVTNPDRPTGRKKVITPPPVKQVININQRDDRQVSCKVLQPEKLGESFVQELKSLNPEFGVLAAYGKIVPKEVINVFFKGIIVVHPSLLPKYRGATPIQNVILAGEKETGTTLILMDEKVDHGPILALKSVAIESIDNYDMLSKKLADSSANLLIEVLPKYLFGEIKPKEQNHALATFTKKIVTEDGFVDLEKDDPEIVWRKVRALNPDPGVYYSENGKRVKILEADLVDGKLVIKKIRREGKK